MKTLPVRNKTIWWSWYHAIFVALLFLVIHGYRFNTGDQEEHLPQVYQMIDAELYPHDYFMQANDHTFSIRFYYKWLVYLFSFLMPVSAVCFLLTLISLTVTAWAVIKITLIYDERRVPAIIAPLLLMILFVNVTIGNNEFQNNFLICSTLAAMFCTLAFLQYYNRRYILMAFFLGLAGWFQVLESVLLAALLFPAMVVLRKVQFRTIFFSGFIFLITVSPMLGPVLYNHFIAPRDYDQQLYYTALYHIRNPNHYIASKFPISEYREFLFLAFVAGIALLRYKVNYKKEFLFFSFIAFAGMVVYYVCIEHLGILVAGKTQWFKSTVWLTMIFSISISIALAEIFYRVISGDLRLYYIIGTVILMGGAVWQLFGSSSPVPIMPKTTYYIGNHPQSDASRMHDWISLNTNKDAVFLVSPANQSFLCEAKRSLLIGFKAVIHEPFFMIPWSQEFQRIYGFEFNANASEAPAVTAYKSYLNKMYIPQAGEKLDYRIDDLNTCAFINDLGEEVHREGSLILTKVKRLQPD